MDPSDGGVLPERARSPSANDALPAASAASAAVEGTQPAADEQADDAAPTPRGGVVGVATANIAAMLMALAVAPLLSRALGPEGRGEAALLGAYEETLAAAFACGIPLAVGYMSKEKIYRDGMLLRSAWRYGIYATPFALVCGIVLVRGPLGDLSMAARVTAVVLITLAPITSTFGDSCRQILLSRGDLETMRLLPLVQMGTRIALIVPAYFAGVLTVAFAAFALRGSFYVSSLYAWHRCRTRFAPGAPLKPMIGFGVRALPGTVSNLVNSRLDQLLIVPFLGTGQLGLYAVAVAINLVPSQLGTALAYDSMARIRPADVTGENSPAAFHLRRAWVTVSALTVVVALAALVGLEPVFGSEFEDAIGATLLLLPGSVALAVNLVAQQAAVSLDKPQYSSYGQAVAVIATLVGLPIAIPLAGIEGAALVSSGAYALRLFTTLYLLRRLGVTHVLPRRRDVSAVVSLRTARRLIRKSRSLRRPRRGR